jgi:hypothetical protein
VCTILLNKPVKKQRSMLKVVKDTPIICNVQR